MQNNSAVKLENGKWQACPVPSVTHIDIPSDKWNQYCAENPKNTIVKFSDGSVFLFDHFGMPEKLNGDAGAEAVEKL